MKPVIGAAVGRIAVCLSYYSFVLFLLFQTWFFTDSDDSEYQEKTSKLCFTFLVVYFTALSVCGLCSGEWIGLLVTIWNESVLS
jgi:quinol-cytochrome oxidoreductase complex cytochrome b subunit